MATVNGMRKEADYTAECLVMIRGQLQRRGITDTRVLQAMREVPRHAFVAPEWRHEAYSDRPLPIADDQTISQPYMVAIMTQSLVLQGHERVLEVGTGSGYQAAVLSRLVTHVYTIEYFPDLAERARTLLQRLGCTNVQVSTGDGGLGLPAYAPYHGILVAAAAPHLKRGVTVLMIEQNAKRALEQSDFGIVLELGCTRMEDRAEKILADPRIGQLFLGGGLEPTQAA